MRTRAIQAAILLVCCGPAHPQGRPVDWPSYYGDAQRTGWEKLDWRITKDNVKDFQLVLKRKLDSGLTPPVIIGLLISYRGFKELAFVAGKSGQMWAIDVDTDRLFWHRQFDATASGPCAASTAVMPALVPPLNFAVKPRPGASAVRPAGGFGAARPIYGVSSDGKLHVMNTSTGEDSKPPITFLPADTSASSLTVVDNMVYTVAGDCGNGAGSVWALDLGSSEASNKPVHYALDAGSISRHGGLAMGTDGTVFVPNGNKLLALTPKKLELANYFANTTANVATPVVFSYSGKELVVTAGADGCLYLLAAKNPGGEDHKTPLSRTEPVSGSFWGGLSTWQDSSGTRYVVAPVWGPTHGSIVAYKMEDKDGKLALVPAWVSGDIGSPEQPVVTGGIVFVLSAGDPGGAVLYALEGATGKELYSTGNQVTAPANLNGLTLANGRVFFTTTDGTLYGFGIYLER